MNLFVTHLVAMLCLSLVNGLEQGVGVYFPNARAVEPCAGKHDGYFANDVSLCEAYFLCKNDTGVPLKCPIGFHFDEAMQVCKHAELVGCVSCPQEGILAQPDLFNCTRFTLCYEGAKIPMECATGFRFDPSSGQCGLVAEVQCPIRCPPGLQTPEKKLIIPSDVDCADYVICNEGTALKFRCPDNTHFNRATSKCETVASAYCPLPTTTTALTLVQRISRSLRKKESEVECPAAGMAFLPNPSDCSLYFICNEGESILRRCAANLVFDLMSNNCNFPEQSVCITDHKNAESVKPENIVKKPDFGPTAATPSKTAATPSGAAPTRWH